MFLSQLMMLFMHCLTATYPVVERRARTTLELIFISSLPSLPPAGYAPVEHVSLLTSLTHTQWRLICFFVNFSYPVRVVRPQCLNSPQCLNIKVRERHLAATLSSLDNEIWGKFWVQTPVAWGTFCILVIYTGGTTARIRNKVEQIKFTFL